MDASAGVGYTFFATLAILYFMKLVVYFIRHHFTSDHTGWWAATDFNEQFLLQDRLQATQQQSWIVQSHTNAHSTYPITQSSQQFALQQVPPAETSATLEP